jgi:NADH dehydrogenase FAD-containing subunit
LFTLVLALAALTLAAASTGHAQAGVCRNDFNPGCGKAKSTDSCSHAAWNAYKKQLHGVEGLWAQADAVDDAAVVEFDEQVGEIGEDMGLGPTLGGLPKAAEVAIQQNELAEAATLENEVMEALENGNAAEYVTLQNKLSEVARGASIGGAVTTGVGTAAELADMYMWAQMTKSAVNNLDQAMQAQAHILDRADTAWAKLLDAAAQAMKQQQACVADQQKLKADQALEQRAEHYVQNLEQGVFNPNGTLGSQWTIGNQTYTSWTAAVNAAKQLLTARGQSSAAPSPQLMHLASYAAPSAAGDTASLSPATAQQVLAILQPAGPNLKAMWAAFIRVIDGDVGVWSQVHPLAKQVNRPR